MAKAKKGKKAPTPPSTATAAAAAAAVVTAATLLAPDPSCPGEHAGAHLDDFLLPDEQLSPRLLALQQQLERLDADRYLLQRAAQDPAGSPLAANLVATASKTEISLQSLKKRLGEVRQQLYGSSLASPPSYVNANLAKLAKSYFGGILGGTKHAAQHHLNVGFPGEGEAFDDGGILLGDIDPLHASELEFIESEFYDEEGDDDDEGAHSQDDDDDDAVARELRRPHSIVTDGPDDGGEDDGGEDDDAGDKDDDRDSILRAPAASSAHDDRYGQSGRRPPPPALLNGLAAQLGTDSTASSPLPPASPSSSLRGGEVKGSGGSAKKRFVDITRLGLRLMDGEISEEEAMLEYNLMNPLEADLQNALEKALAAPSETQVALIREKFQVLAKQDCAWRARVQRASRIAHDERIQRQLIEMELDKANAIKQRLESLCRDLHNENRRIKAEGARREEMAAAAAAAAAISALPTAQSQSPSGPPAAEFPLPPLPSREQLGAEPGAVLVDRLLSLAELHGVREQHFAALLRQRDLEAMISAERADILAAQLSKQTSTLDASTRRIAALTRSEAELKAQVRQYVDKFRQVEETLGKSNDLFGTFRAEMEQMGAKLARLERENAQLNSKCATLSRNIIEMADERTKQNAAMDTLKGQKAKLEQLCRTLQAERNAALKGVATPGGDEASASPSYTCQHHHQQQQPNQQSPPPHQPTPPVLAAHGSGDPGEAS